MLIDKKVKNNKKKLKMINYKKNMLIIMLLPKCNCTIIIIVMFR